MKTVDKLKALVRSIENEDDTTEWEAVFKENGHTEWKTVSVDEAIYCHALKDVRIKTEIVESLFGDRWLPTKVENSDKDVFIVIAHTHKGHKPLFTRLKHQLYIKDFAEALKKDSSITGFYVVPMTVEVLMPDSVFDQVKES